MNLLARLCRLSVYALCLLPAAVQAHPGHSAFDPTGGAPHAGHNAEWSFSLLLVAVTGVLLGAKWLARRRR